MRVNQSTRSKKQLLLCALLLCTLTTYSVGSEIVLKVDFTSHDKAGKTLVDLRKVFSGDGLNWSTKSLMPPGIALSDDGRLTLEEFDKKQPNSEWKLNLRGTRDTTDPALARFIEDLELSGLSDAEITDTLGLRRNVVVVLRCIPPRYASLELRHDILYSPRDRATLLGKSVPGSVEMVDPSEGDESLAWSVDPWSGLLIEGDREQKSLANSAQAESFIVGGLYPRSQRMVRFELSEEGLQTNSPIEQPRLSSRMAVAAAEGMVGAIPADPKTLSAEPTLLPDSEPQPTLAPLPEPQPTLAGPELPGPSVAEPQPTLADVNEPTPTLAEPQPTLANTDEPQPTLAGPIEPQPTLATAEPRSSGTVDVVQESTNDQSSVLGSADRDAANVAVPTGPHPAAVVPASRPDSHEKKSVFPVPKLLPTVEHKAEGQTWSVILIRVGGILLSLILLVVAGFDIIGSNIRKAHDKRVRDRVSAELETKLEKSLIFRTPQEKPQLEEIKRELEEVYNRG